MLADNSVRIILTYGPPSLLTSVVDSLTDPGPKHMLKFGTNTVVLNFHGFGSNAISWKKPNLIHKRKQPSRKWYEMVVFPWQKVFLYIQGFILSNSVLSPPPPFWDHFFPRRTSLRRVGRSPNRRQGGVGRPPRENFWNLWPKKMHF